MAGRKDPSEADLTLWQVRAKRMIEPILQVPENREFIEDIAKVTPETEWDDKVDNLIMVILGLPRNSREFLKHYMRTGEQDYSLLKQAQLKVLSEIDRTLIPGEDPKLEYERWQRDRELTVIPEVQLILDPTITKEELLEYIDKRFTQDIQPKLELISGGPAKRVRGRPKLKRDGKVLDEIAKGKHNARIAREFKSHQGVDTSEDIIQIKKRRKKDRAI